MSKTKQTVPLSQILDHATNEVHPSPCVKAYATIAKIITTIPNAQIALRIQLVSKMKAYCNGFLPKKEMYYCLCLSHYLVLQCPEFRQQVLHPDFISLFERSADFEKFKKASKKPGIVTEKAMRILQSWGPLFPNELVDYQLLYDKYVSKGVIFPTPEKLPVNVKMDHTEIEQQLDDLINDIEECTELIFDALEEKIRKFELNSSFNALFVKYTSASDNTSKIQFFSEIETNFSASIVKLATIINKPQEALIYRTFTTGHLTDDKEEPTPQTSQTSQTNNTPVTLTSISNTNDAAQIKLLQQASGNSPLRQPIRQNRAIEVISPDQRQPNNVVSLNPPLIDVKEPDPLWGNPQQQTVKKRSKFSQSEFSVDSLAHLNQQQSLL
ncbi:VHS domain-containing protein [Entamoeba marina]